MDLIKRGSAGAWPAQRVCKCASHDMPENPRYYNNANKNGKLWILYRCIKTCNFSVAWITLWIAALALWKEAALLHCFVCLWTYCYLTILRTEIIDENLTQGATLKGRWDSLPHLPPVFPPSHPTEHCYLTMLLQWEVILLMNKIKRLYTFSPIQAPPPFDFVPLRMVNWICYRDLSRGHHSVVLF